ncbi:MAG: hypothetical protein J0M15_09100 [Deltaproteobacteria bacterium]|nr:hypothetical protein [Deltaproteobacteria bacterium]
MKAKNRNIFSLLILICGVMLGYYFQKNQKMIEKLDSSSHEVGKLKYENILNTIQEKKMLFSGNAFYQSDACVRELNHLYDLIYPLKVTDFDQTNVGFHFLDVLRSLFNFRVQMRESFQKHYFEGSTSAECAFAHRRVFRSLRVLEDFVGIYGTGMKKNIQGLEPSQLNKKEDFFRAFEGNYENFLWNESYKPANPLAYQPQSGDVLLSRGSASVSAAIARITDEDSNFSHIGMIYVDPKTKSIETIEAHIELGTVVTDIKKYKDLKVRSLVFRFRDPQKTKEENSEMAHQAASKVRAQVLEYKSKYGSSDYPNVCYDFTMNVDNPIQMEPSKDPSKRKCLFCSEVVSLGFSLVNEGKYKIPTFFSSIKPKNRKFIEDIGVGVDKTFAPADIEIDPYFDLVLEWRDFERVHKSHQMDAILTAVYNWMDEFDYQFFPSEEVRQKVSIGYTARRIPLINKLFGVVEKFPLNLSKNGVQAIYLMDLIAKPLNLYIVDKEKMNNTLFTSKEMIELLNDWRVKDLAEYSTQEPEKNYGRDQDPYKNYRFHNFFRSAEINKE